MQVGAFRTSCLCEDKEVKKKKSLCAMCVHAGDDDEEEKRAKRRSLIAVMKCQVYLFANTLLALTNANKSTFCFASE